MPLSLMLQRLQLHPVCKRFLTGQDLLPLEVGIDHNDGGLVVIQLPHQHRHGGLPCQLAPPLAAVARHQLIAALRSGPHDARNQYAILGDARRRLLHRLIVPYLERMPLERVQVRQRDVLDALAGSLRPAGLEEGVKAGHLDLPGTAFRAMTSCVSAAYAAETLPAGSWR